MKRTALLWMLGLFAMVGCNPEYAIVGEIGKEYIFIEVPVMTRMKTSGLTRSFSPRAQRGLIFFGLSIDLAL